LRSGELNLSHNYSSLLSLEALLLLTSIYFLSNDSLNGHYLASAAYGLQNALATTLSGAVIRTTHVTGIFTDFGIMLGAKSHGEEFDKKKASLLLIIIGFTLGGTFGAYFFSVLKFNTLLIPAGICLLLAFSYSLYKAKVNN
jgi:uncharacterized membrane protein YoaK (UPF0700 family)